MINNDFYYDNLSNSYKSQYRQRYQYIESVNNKIFEFLKSNNKYNILDIGVGDGERAKSLISKKKILKKNY